VKGSAEKVLIGRDTTVWRIAAPSGGEVPLKYPEAGVEED
jgi:hypothetical protein